MCRRINQWISLLLAFTLMCQILAGCSDEVSSSNTKSEIIVHENQIYEQLVSEEKFQEKFIIENLVYDDGIYEYQIAEGFYSEAYVFEMTVGELSNEELLVKLPKEIQEYDIDWPKVIAKFAVGTTIIVVVGIVNHFAKGTTYFLFGSAASVAKDALVSGAMAVVLRNVASVIKDGGVPEKGIAKYAIEGFADGFMWGAIASILKISKENLTRLKAFKTATGGSLSINVVGQVFDETGKIVGKAVYSNAGIWYLIDEASKVIQIFDKAGKAITDKVVLNALKNLPHNSILRMGTDAEPILCYTDDVGQIIRIGDDLIPNIEYTLNGYTYYTDELGRITKVSFEELRLRPSDQARKMIKDGKDVIGKGFQLADDDRGHLIADMFDGDNSLANIVVQDGTVNKGKIKEIETVWQNCLKEGGSVNGTIELMYTENSFRPDYFMYYYNIGGDIFEKLISNII